MENNSGLDKIKPFLKDLKKNCFFKIPVSSVISFSVSALFALYNGYLGIRLLSIWHGGICVFYLLLAAIRGIILLTEKNNRTKDDRQRSKCRQRTFIISAFLLLLLNLALALPISLMVIFERPVNMGLIPAITVAIYTTYKITIASIHIQKQKRSNNNILTVELRTINFIDALFSILTLQNTLIMVKQTASSGNDMLVLSAISSAAIYAVIILVTVRLLIRGLKKNIQM